VKLLGVTLMYLAETGVGSISSNLYSPEYATIPVESALPDSISTQLAPSSLFDSNDTVLVI
jgi:hypothetical protein